MMGGNDGPLFRTVNYYGVNHHPERRGLLVSTCSGDGDSDIDGNAGDIGLRVKELEFEDVEVLSGKRYSIVFT